MLMTGDEIVEAHGTGEIAIDPFLPANVNTASYDVALGPFFYRQHPHGLATDVSSNSHFRGPTAWRLYNPYDQRYIEKTWVLETADPAFKFPTMEGIDDDDFVIAIGPKEIILAHTLEFIGSVPQLKGISITTMMHSRSSSVRNCIDVCGSGGFGDAGFCSRWTLEIINNSSHYTTYLVVGRRLAQISFHRIAPIKRDYAQEGKYHGGMSLEELKKNWTPEMMLPRMYKDREVGKANLHQKLINSLLKLK